MANESSSRSEYLFKREGVELLVVNESEGRQLAGLGTDASDEAILARLQMQCETGAVVLTLGERGAFYSDADEQLHQPATKVDVVDSTAAGDTFVGYFVATLAYSIMTFSWWFAEANEPLFLLLGRGVLFGLIAGGMLLMGNAMLQDVMDEDYRRTGERKNGMFAGSYSLIEKVTSGIGAQVLGLVLSYTGFVRGAEVQSESAVGGIYVVTALIPGLLMLVSLAVIKTYRLDESRLT